MRTWEECYADPVGTVYADEMASADVDGGRLSVRGLIMRGPYALTAYVGLPHDHPTAGWPGELVPLDVHGDLTLSAAGDGGRWPAGWWWYGWDYGHAFDRMLLPGDMFQAATRLGGTAWTPDMILPEMRAAAEQLLELARAGWMPSKEALAEQAEIDRSVVEWRADPAAATERLQTEFRKMARRRELDG